MKRIFIIGIALFTVVSFSLQSCSPKTCPAYNTYPKTKRLR
ncbi:MAG TPA: hypothetical protein VNQ80_08555 [Parapedobacter sp.]|nr:hypothetical protein [Parapedobacter sp.]HWK57374.1 hypothetical protein [Parapedobacter sp.]